MKISLIQMNSNRALEENVGAACRYIDQAALQEPDIIVIPEFFNRPYFSQYRDLAKYVSWAEKEAGYSLTRIREKAVQHKVHIIATLYEEAAPGHYYDTAMVLSPEGEILGKYRKTHPAAVLSLEKIYFRFGSKFPIFKIHDWKVGIIICYDTFFPETSRIAGVKGAELLLIPFASSNPVPEMWQPMLRTRAFDNGLYLAACNKVGQEGDWFFPGESYIIDPLGRVLAQASKKEDEIIHAELKKEEVYAARVKIPTFRDRRPDLYRALVAPSEEAIEEG